MELNSVTQQEVVDEISPGKKEITASAEQQPYNGIRDMLKAWETVALYVEMPHHNKAVAMCATILFNSNSISHFS